MTQGEALDRTVVLAFDDLKPTLRTDAILLLGAVAMVAGTFGILVLADAVQAEPLRWGAVLWCGLILLAMRFVMTSPRFTKVVHYRLTLRPAELDIERRSPDLLSGTTRLPRGTASLRRPYVREGGEVRYCEIRLSAGRLALRAHDQPVVDDLSGEGAPLGDWLERWFAAPG